MGSTLLLSPVVWSDNTIDMALSENPIHHSKMKHVAVVLFFVREKVQSWEIVVNFVRANEQVAEILTKILTEKSFIPCRKKLGVFYVLELLELTSPASPQNT